MKDTLRIIKEHDLFNLVDRDLIDRFEKDVVFEIDEKDKPFVEKMENALDLAYESVKLSLEFTKHWHKNTKYDKSYRQAIWTKFADYQSHLCEVLEDFLLDGYFLEDELYYLKSQSEESE